MIDETLPPMFASQWPVAIVVSLLLLGAAELGFRLGLRLHRTGDEARKGQIAGTQGATLALLGLLLAFTFSLCEARYEARRRLVLEEANAIGTTYLRAALLPETHRVAVESLLRRYVDVRLRSYDAGTDRARVAAAEDSAARIQRELWQHAVQAGHDVPSPLVVAFINALNETIDLDAARLEALRAQAPGAVWLLVLVVACCGCCVSGYGAGSSGARAGFSDLVLPLLIAVAITIIADLDRPRSGMIGISQQPLLDLQTSLSATQRQP